MAKTCYAKNETRSGRGKKTGLLGYLKIDSVFSKAKQIISRTGKR
ncbi:hypothetical protein LPICM17_540051 [Lactococcus piscium]|nr:hypothetical protein LP2241_50187 [Lactococcus piscium]SOB48409.1 hypothetical protein LPICM17_540051 [Lactococcus piscium]